MLNRQFRAACVGLAIFVCVSFLGAAEENTSGKRIVLVKGPSIEAQLFDAVVKFTRGNISAVVEVGKYPNGLAKLSPKAQFASLGELLDKKDICAVALLREPASIPERILLTRATRSGVVNLSRLQREVPDRKKNRDRFHHLVQKEALRAIGYIVGLKECPNPRCAMSGYKVPPKASFGRNYCPPCLIQAEKLLGVTKALKKKPVPEKKLRKGTSAPSSPPAKPSGE